MHTAHPLTSISILYTGTYLFLRVFYLTAPGYRCPHSSVGSCIRWTMCPLDHVSVRCVRQAGGVTTTAPTQACTTVYILQCSHNSTHTTSLILYYSTHTVYSHCTAVLILCAHANTFNTGLTAAVSEWLGRMRQATSASTQVYIYNLYMYRLIPRLLSSRLQNSITKATIQYYQGHCSRWVLKYLIYAYHVPCTIIRRAPCTIRHAPYTTHDI
jgi:hypothetical protein